MHTRPSSALPEDGDVTRISSKLCNILLNPAQSHHLVFQAVVTGNYCVASTQESYMTVTTAVRLHSYQNVTIWLQLNRLAYLHFLVRQQVQKLAIKLDLVRWHVSSVTLFNQSQWYFGLGPTVHSQLATYFICPSQSVTKPNAIELRKDTSVTLHWVKGHSGLKVNEKADYLARIVASYKPTTTYDAIPVSRGKRLLEEYYIRIWNETYTNSEKGSHTTTLIPSVLHRMTLTLWPNHVLTQFLTNHGSFRSYLYKRKRRLHHYVAAPKRLNKQPNISWLTAAYSPKKEQRCFKNFPSPK